MTTLRRLLQDVVQAIGDKSTHACLPEVCRRLGLPEPPLVAGAERRRAVASLAALPDCEVPAVAQNFLDQEDVDAPARNAIEDELWAPYQGLSIPTRTRRDIASELGLQTLVRILDRFTAIAALYFVVQRPRGVVLGGDAGRCLLPRWPRLCGRPAVRAAAAAGEMKLVGIAVHGGPNGVDKALKGLTLHP